MPTIHVEFSHHVEANESFVRDTIDDAAIAAAEYAAARIPQDAPAPVSVQGLYEGIVGAEGTDDDEISFAHTYGNNGETVTLREAP